MKNVILLMLACSCLLAVSCEKDEDDSTPDTSNVDSNGNNGNTDENNDGGGAGIIGQIANNTVEYDGRSAELLRFSYNETPVGTVMSVIGGTEVITFNLGTFPTSSGMLKGASTAAPKEGEYVLTVFTDSSWDKWRLPKKDNGYELEQDKSMEVKVEDGKITFALVGARLISESDPNESIELSTQFSFDLATLENLDVKNEGPLN